MFFRLQNAVRRWRLNWTLRKVRDSPPALLDPQSRFALISQIREKDIFMYLLAVKSFCRWVRPKNVHLLTDGDFRHETLRLLERHIPGITLTPHIRYRDSRCPSGGTWERLLALATHADQSYVIQLDSDTITLEAPREVGECISANLPFTLGSLQGQKIDESEASALRAERWLQEGDHHVQILAESVLDKAASNSNTRYVRGCSAFVGIPQGKLTPDIVAGQAAVFAGLLGTRWNEWGTEQFMSNLLIANMEGSVVLPHPQYATCPNVDEDRTLVAHMAGFCRFSNGQYARFANRVLAAP